MWGAKNNSGEIVPHKIPSKRHRSNHRHKRFMLRNPTNRDYVIPTDRHPIRHHHDMEPGGVKHTAAGGRQEGGVHVQVASAELPAPDRLQHCTAVLV